MTQGSQPLTELSRPLPVSQPGRIVAGRFVFEELAGSTSHAEVWRATDRSCQREVAIKVFRYSGTDDYCEEMFFREVSALEMLRHPHIVRLFGRGRDPESGQPYLVKEFVAGGSLASALSQHETLDPPTRVSRLSWSVSAPPRFADGAGETVAEVVSQLHTSRSAAIGSILVARQAGMQLAAIATTSSSRGTSVKMAGSRGRTP